MKMKTHKCQAMSVKLGPQQKLEIKEVFIMPQDYKCYALRIQVEPYTKSYIELMIKYCPFCGELLQPDLLVDKRGGFTLKKEDAL